MPAFQWAGDSKPAKLFSFLLILLTTAHFFWETPAKAEERLFYLL